MDRCLTPDPHCGGRNHDCGSISFSFHTDFLFQCGLLYLAGFLFAGLMVAIWILLRRRLCFMETVLYIFTSRQWD